MKMIHKTTTVYEAYDGTHHNTADEAILVELELVASRFGMELSLSSEGVWANAGKDIDVEAFIRDLAETILGQQVAFSEIPVPRSPTARTVQWEDPDMF